MVWEAVESTCNAAIRDALPVTVNIFDKGDPALDQVAHFMLVSCHGPSELYWAVDPDPGPLKKRGKNNRIWLETFPCSLKALK